MNLRELITTLKGSRTYIQLAADCGGYPSDKRLQQLGTQRQKNFPDPDTIHALARGLRVAEVTVVLAAAEDLGLDVARASPKILDFMPPGVNDLEDEQLHAIGNLVRSFAEAQTEALGRVSRMQTGLIVEYDPDQQTADANRRSRDPRPIQYQGDDLAEAARKPPLGGSRGRQARRAQDEAETGSQDPDDAGGDA